MVADHALDCYAVHQKSFPVGAASGFAVLSRSASAAAAV